LFWNLSTAISIFATLIYGVIFIIVIFSRPRNLLRRIFAIYLLTMISWSVSAFLSTSGLVTVLPWFKVMASSPIVMMLSIYFFVQSLFGLRPKLARIMILYGLIAIAITLRTNIVVQEAFLNETGDLFYQLGPFFWVVAVPGYILMILSIVELLRAYRASLDTNQRNRIRYLLLGLIITSLASFVNFTEYGKYPFDVAANGITAMLIAYAILRHQLLDIRVVVRLGILYSVTTAFFGLIYYLSISIVSFFSQLIVGQEIFVISLIIGAFSAFLLTPIRNQVQTWIDIIFYREKYHAGLMLQQLSETTASLLDLDQLTDLILRELSQALHIEDSAILVKGSEENNFSVIAELGHNQKILTDFRADHPIIRWLSQNPQTITKKDLIFNPSFKSLWSNEKKELEKFQAELFVPLSTKGKFVGLLIVGVKRSSQPYTQDDLLILSALANQTAVAIENARLYEELEETFVQTISALANAIDIRDTYTSSHSQRIANWAAAIGRHLDFPADEIRTIYWGGLLHDIGKIGIPDEILRKPAKLNKNEWKIIKQHTVMGARLVSQIKKISNVAPIIEYSHERYDGLGYPHGIKGNNIPIGARIISVVDSYSAMRDERPYKKPFSFEKAVDELKQNSGSMYDPQIVEAFIRILETDQVYQD
jgi:putative nucleotidyltransferase with HDIG domain